ncbi:MAG TPA: lycopene cyclase domain-containing protein [Flavobacteriales bacterium]|nr:lycopene cyclase domain-containing protein [Flavobacteriales bacterium]
MKSLYLILDIAAISGPLFLSFDKKVNFIRQWKFAFAAILCMMLIFIPWDSIFTYYGIWGFNEKYTLGPRYAYLPIEEWLFFPATHFAVVFMYECLNTYIKKDVLARSYKFMLCLFILIGLIVAIFYPSQLYSSLKMGGAAVLTFVVLFFWNPKWLSRFTLCFLVSLLPFFIMNSILTGSFLDEPIVWYNPHHIFNIRIGTIPVEDIFYNLFMLLTTFCFYHWFKSWKNDPLIHYPHQNEQL